jgi:hypothetical protein
MCVTVGLTIAIGVFLDAADFAVVEVNGAVRFSGALGIFFAADGLAVLVVKPNRRLA